MTVSVADHQHISMISVVSVASYTWLHSGDCEDMTILQAYS